MDDNEEISTPKSRVLNFDFQGDGFEYFKIWIVNVLLTILTLGIYSAWAKVRTNRYFYSNLNLDGSNFRYLADPLTILKGRVIAVVTLFAFILISNVSPEAGMLLTIVLIFSIPFFINQSLAFNNRMTSYKNIQFRFKGSYGEAFMVLYVWPLVGVLTLGILYPMALLRLNQYIVRNSAYGTCNFEFDATYKDYGIIFLISIGIVFLFAIPIAILSIAIPEQKEIATLPMLFVYLAVFIYFTIAATNLYYRSAILNEHEFNANLTIGGYTKVILINALLTVLTLGLYLPAAKVRMTRYLVDNIQFHANGSLDYFAAAERENISALGEEFGQVFDFGI